MVKLANTLALGASGATLGSSSLPLGTIFSTKKSLFEGIFYALGLAEGDAEVEGEGEAEGETEGETEGEGVTTG